MRRTLVVAFAVLGSLLLVSAPVGTATQGSAELVVVRSRDDGRPAAGPTER